jgi:undecaprenyl-diphosphatase
MLSYSQAVILGLLQGFAELFPISSLGHTVLIPALLGWSVERTDNQFVAFLVLTHLATSLVLMALFWRDWLATIRGMFRSLSRREIAPDDTSARIGWLLVVSTIPAGVLGLLFEERLKLLFGSADIVAVALVANGIVLHGVEILRRRQATEYRGNDDGNIASLSWSRATIVGIAQCFALVPGFSRTGLTMGAGLACGLSHESAARYSFLLATPIIFAAAVLKVPDLFTSGTDGLGIALIGAACAAVTAFFSTRFLLRYFETDTLRPFGSYCIAAGIVSLVLLFL